MPVRIVTILCSKCGRKFRTVWSVIEFSPPRRCSACGGPITISEPETIDSRGSDPSARDDP